MVTIHLQFAISVFNNPLLKRSKGGVDTFSWESNKRVTAAVIIVSCLFYFSGIVSLMWLLMTTLLIGKRTHWAEANRGPVKRLSDIRQAHNIGAFTRHRERTASACIWREERTYIFYILMLTRAHMHAHSSSSVHTAPLKRNYLVRLT